MTKGFSKGYLRDSRVLRGVDVPIDEQSEWQLSADGWTIELCSSLTTESQPGVWPAFHYWKGKGHKGKAPTVSDLVFSVASDCSYLESEPEEVSWVMGCQIKHNEQKMQLLFGELWEEIKGYSEEEIEEAFGEFS